MVDVAGGGDGVFELSRLCRYFSELSPQPMVAVEGISHSIRYVNDAFARLVRKGRGELIGRRFAEAVPEGDDNGCQRLLDRVYKSGSPENLIEQRHEGLTPPAYWSYAVWAILGADDRPAGVMIQVTDATEVAIFRKSSMEMNQALVISSMSQHELTEVAEKLNASFAASELGAERLVEITRQ